MEVPSVVGMHAGETHWMRVSIGHQRTGALWSGLPTKSAREAMNCGIADCHCARVRCECGYRPRGLQSESRSMKT